MKKDKPDLQPELKDIIDSLYRYLAVRKNNACFVMSFIAFKEGTCDNCGDECDDIIDEKGSTIFAYGDKETLRDMLFEMRNTIEDIKTDDGFINI